MKPAVDLHSQAVTPAPPDQQQPRHPARDLLRTVTVPGYTGTFGGRAEEATRVRREVAAYLSACPAADDMILIASELAANAVLHTRSRGASFMVRCQASPGQVRIEVEDLGGPWRQRRDSADRPHGLDIISALTGPDGWGTQAAGTGGRIIWARLSW
jgi:serine/threonine-protein kinase RsbW